MARKSKKTAEAKGQRGRKSHFNTAQIDFLKQYAAQWQEARKSKKPSTFYNTVTTGFISRFGYGSVLDDDGEVPPELEVLEPVEGEKVPGTAGLTAEEATVKVAYYTRLRTVRNIGCLL